MRRSAVLPELSGELSFYGYTAIDLILQAKQMFFRWTKEERKGTGIREHIPPRWVDKFAQKGGKKKFRIYYLLNDQFQECLTPPKESSKHGDSQKVNLA